METTKLSGQRVAVLVDVQNQYYAAKELAAGGRLDFGRLMDALNDREIIRAIAYVAVHPSNDLVAFFAMLGHYGFEVRPKEVEVHPDGMRQGDCDMEIACDAFALAERVDVIVLVTGDGDFVPVVRFLQSKGVKVEVVSFASPLSRKLRHAADSYWTLDDGMVYTAQPVLRTTSVQTHRDCPSP